MSEVWSVEYTDQFEAWWDDLRVDEQVAIAIAVEALEERGPALGRPFVDTIKGSRHPNMKELRRAARPCAFSSPSTRIAPPSF